MYFNYPALLKAFLCLSGTKLLDSVSSLNVSDVKGWEVHGLVQMKDWWFNSCSCGV